MSTKLSQLIREAIELPIHDLGHKKQVPHGELSSFVSEEDEEELKKHDNLDEEGYEEDEEELEEDLSVADHEKNLPVHSLEYSDEIPDEELLALIGGEEEREEADLELGSDQILPDPSVNEEKEEEEDAVHESSGAAKRQRVKELKAAVAQEKKSLKAKEASLQAAAEAAFDKGDMKAYGAALKKQKALYSRLRSLEDELDDVVADVGTLREADDEDVEDAVNEALRLLSKNTKRKSKLIREEEEDKDNLEEEDEENGEDDELHEDDMPGDGVYHKGGDEHGAEKREIDEEEEKEEEEEEEKDEIEEGLNAIFEGKTLSKSFKKKTATIFEAAVKSKVSKERAKIREAYKLASLAHRKIQEDKLVNKLSDYLDYAVNEWTKQNKVAIENSLKSQITEEFIDGLKSLFESKYIEVPQTKKNVLQNLAKKVEKLESQLNEQTKSNIELHKSLKKAKRDLIIHKACEGLTDSNKERLVSLTENFQFTTAKEFAEKVLTIRKSFFEKTGSSSKSTNNRMTKSGIEIKENFDGNYEVDAYIDAFRKRNL